MDYISTRGNLEQSSFCDILLEGLAADGGLYVPKIYPKVNYADLSALRAEFNNEGYAKMATKILALFIDDIPVDDLKSIVKRAYDPKYFTDPAIVPVDQFGDQLFIAHLSNGPTAAFKDIAMRLLGELFSYELNKQGRRLNILGATSGDTGSAAEYALMGKPGITVFMLTPAGRMTPFQQAQMFSIDNPNIVNIAVDGVFDDCQDIVKEINADAEFKAKYAIGAVNSINWARLLAQIVYYFAAWVQVARHDEEVSFAVPSGNFGNICAGHIAKQMGLPIKKLVLSTNENNVLEEFFNTGVYRVRAASETLATSSPSMDISKASNFERFIFDLLGRDQKIIRKLFNESLNSSGKFDLSGYKDFAAIKNKYGFVAGSSAHANRIDTIKYIYQKYGYLVDPHTADAIYVAKKHLAKEPMIILETALPVKFADTIKEALNITPPCPARFARIEEAKKKVIRVPNEVESIKNIIAQHSAKFL